MPEQEVHEHIDPLGAYITVFIALMILLLLTVGAYLYDFGAHWGEKWGVLNTALALLIASVKAGLVMLVFMHLRHATKLTWVVAASGFIWLCIMVVFSYGDYLSRNAIPEWNPNPDLTGTETKSAMVSSNDTPPATQPMVSEKPGF
jgi:cytochrome c oxidase subunit 4